MCSQESKAVFYFLLLFSLMLVICRKYFTRDYLNYEKQSLKVLLPASGRGMSTGPAQDSAIGFPLGRLIQWGGFWWELLCHKMCVWPGTGLWAPLGKAAPHPVQVGIQIWGVVPRSAWAVHAIISLLSHRLDYSRDWFQIISSKFPPCNNRNLI